MLNQIIMIAILLMALVRMTVQGRFHQIENFNMSKELPAVNDFSVTPDGVMLYRSGGPLDVRKLYMLSGKQFQNIYQTIYLSSPYTNSHKQQKVSQAMYTAKYWQYGVQLNYKQQLASYSASSSSIPILSGEKSKPISINNYIFTAIKSSCVKLMRVNLTSNKVSTYEYQSEYLSDDPWPVYLADMENGLIAVAAVFGQTNGTVMVINPETMQIIQQFKVDSDNNQDSIVGLFNFYNIQTNESVISVRMANNVYKSYYAKQNSKHNILLMYYNPSTVLNLRKMRQGISLYGNQVLKWKDIYDTTLKRGRYSQYLNNRYVIAVQSNSNKVFLISHQTKSIIECNINQTNFQLKKIAQFNIGALADCITRGQIIQNYLWLQLKGCNQQTKDNVCRINTATAQLKCIGPFEKYYPSQSQNLNKIRQQIGINEVSQQKFTSFVVYKNRVSTVVSYNIKNRNVESDKDKQFVYVFQSRDKNTFEVIGQTNFTLPTEAYDFRILYKQTWGTLVTVLAKINKDTSNDDCMTATFMYSISDNNIVHQSSQVNSKLSYYNSQAAGPFVVSLKVQPGPLQYLRVCFCNTIESERIAFPYAVNSSDAKFELISQGNYLLVVSGVENGPLYQATDFYNFSVPIADYAFQGRLYRNKMFNIRNNSKNLQTNFIMVSLKAWMVYNIDQSFDSTNQIVYNLNTFPITQIKPLITQQSALDNLSDTAYIRTNQKCNYLIYGAQFNLYKDCISQGDQQTLIGTNVHNHVSNANDVDQKLIQLFTASTGKHVVGVFASDSKSNSNDIHYRVKINEYEESNINQQTINITLPSSQPLLLDISSFSQLAVVKSESITFLGVNHYQLPNTYGVKSFEYTDMTRSGCQAIAGRTNQSASSWKVVISKYPIYQYNKTDHWQISYQQNITAIKLSQDCNYIAIYFQTLNSTILWDLDLGTPISTFKDDFQTNSTLVMYFGSAQKLVTPEFLIMQTQRQIRVCTILHPNYCGYTGGFVTKANFTYSLYGDYVATFSNIERRAEIYYLRVYNVTNDNAQVIRRADYGYATGFYYFYYQTSIANMYFDRDNRLYILWVQGTLQILDPTPCPPTFDPWMVYCLCNQNFTRYPTNCTCQYPYILHQQNRTCTCPDTFTYVQNYHTCTCDDGNYVDQPDLESRQCLNCSQFCVTCSGPSLSGCIVYSGLFYFMIIGTGIAALGIIAIIAVCCWRAKKRRRLEQCESLLRSSSQNIRSQITHKYETPDEVKAQIQPNRDSFLSAQAIQDDATRHLRRDESKRNNCEPYF